MKKYNFYYEKCHNNLLESPEALNYLTSKGISEETIEKYNIGFDSSADPSTRPGSLIDVTEAPNFKYIDNYTDEEIKQHNDGKKYYTPRIIYPCNDNFYIAESIDPETPYIFKQ